MRRLVFSQKIALIGFLATMPVLVVLWAFFLGSKPRSAFEVVVDLGCAGLGILPDRPAFQRDPGPESAGAHPWTA